MYNILFQIILQAETGQYNYDIKWKELFLADSFAIKWKCSPNIVCRHHGYAGLSLTPVPLLPGGSCHPHRGHAILIKVQDTIYFFKNGTEFFKRSWIFGNAQEMTALVCEETGTTLQVVLLYVVHMFVKGGASWRRGVTEFRYIAARLGRAGAAQTNGHGYQRHSLSLTYSILDVICTEQLWCY